MFDLLDFLLLFDMLIDSFVSEKHNVFTVCCFGVHTVFFLISALRKDFITDIVGMLMTNSVDRTAGTSFARLDRVIENTQDALADALSGNSSVANAVNLTAVIRTFFRDGISRFYFDLTFNDQSPEATACGVNVIFSLLFPRVEQDKMSMLAGNLQQMGDIFQLVRGVSSL